MERKPFVYDKKSYLAESVPPFTLGGAAEEAARCLLCHDSPCSADCPAGTDPGSFIRSIRLRNFKGAAATIKKNNILGGVCARVCPYERTCEAACSRTGIDKPIEIGRLQRFATDYAKAVNFSPLRKVAADKAKVAVVGSGPAGLACAAALVQRGFQVTVFESRLKPGGILSYGITPSRLPQYVTDEEIETIKDLGVEFECGCLIGRDKTLDQLRAAGFKAFFIGVGRQKAIVPDLAGNDLAGVYTAMDYLDAAKTAGEVPAPGKKVVIIGCGDVAMDCAATSRLLGAERTMLLYRRTREEAPATRKELTHIESLGVQFYFEFAPSEILGDGKKVTGISGKGYRDGSTITLQADTVVFAIGQRPQEEVAALSGCKVSDSRDIVAGQNGQTSLPDVFAGGDIIEGQKTVVDAVNHGKKAAAGIAAFLGE